ncbi:hypothetical protein A2U01_0055958 [Trifolium medium]|uniref:Uncharacterized protein n=1 Tax=Trifolium medium TaxID=97028 RepID=A0A392RDP4_9FABA|nr:hypothetical protein [Trifolium medium]
MGKLRFGGFVLRRRYNVGRSYSFGLDKVVGATVLARICFGVAGD